jgi:16S rRNA (uracil1498-N3)-methyltransferase
LGLPIFYQPLDDIPEVSSTISIVGDEARHLLRSLRAKTGDDVMVSDGAGIVVCGVLIDTGAGEAPVRVLSSGFVEPERPSIVLLQGLVKLPRMDEAVTRAAETGAAEFVPFRSPRSEDYDGRKASERMERWSRIAREASKVARRPHILRVSPVAPWPPVEVLRDAGLSVVLWEEKVSERLVDVLPDEPPVTVAIVTGPVGGLSVDDVKILKEAGAVPVSLGSLILRAESAGSYAAMLLREKYGYL